MPGKNTELELESKIFLIGGGGERHTKTFSDPEEAEAATNQGTYVSQERAMGATVRAE